MVEIKEISYKSSDLDKESFIRAYIEIFNSPNNLKNLSFTGISFNYDLVKSWVGFLNENSEIKYRIAIIDQKIVGICVLNVSVLSGFEIMGLGVHPEYKRKKIGTELVNDSIKLSENYNSIDAIVFTDNKPMLLLMIKNDFIPVIMKNEFRYDGTNTILLKRYQK